jgi:eukaryotic-like serine/threonine-protein kinase
VIGRHVSNFYILGRLGSGGMGDVYEAQDMRLPRAVAVKLLKPSLTQSRVAVKRFRREAWLAASLNHPNICTILDVGEADGLFFIAMELLQGESLKQRLRNGALAVAEMLDVAIDITRALMIAHDAGIIHRDLTPGNVFLTERGPAKLLDFGLAKVIASEDDESRATESLTAEGGIPGTLHHLAPEQIDNRPVDRRTDLFALGTVLYYAATGARPFDAKGRIEIFSKILSADPVPLRRLAPHYPVEFERIVAKLLAKSPEVRYQRASDLLKDLELVRNLQQVESRVAPRPTRDAAAIAVAVLPFAILGDDDAALRGFRDGLPEDLAWWLRKLPGIRVAPRTSTDSLRGQSIRQIGERLAVDAVIEGSVQRADTRIRVIVNFIHSKTEEALRAPVRIDTAADDLLSVQDAVARQIVAAVKSIIAQVNTSVGTKNADAYHEYQRGLHHMRDMFGGAWRDVIEHATRATELDPAFAPAHVMLADAYCFLGLLSLMTPSLAFKKAKRAAHRALALDESLAPAHSALALVRFGDEWDWDGAEAAFRRALDLDPDLASARMYYSWLLGLLGREAAAFTEAERAVTTSRSRVVLAGTALTYFMATKYTEAIERCQECLARDPNYIFATYLRGQCYHMLRDYAAAHADLERAAELGQRAPFFLGLLGKSYGEAGLHDRAASIIEELDRIATRQYVAPHCYVYVLHGMGERERAMQHQEQAYRDGAPPLNYLTPFIRNLFSLDPLHRDRLRQMRLSV